MEKCKCQKCNKEWIPRVKNPEQCPKCKSYDWKKKAIDADREAF